MGRMAELWQEQQELYGHLTDESDAAWAQHQLELRQMQEECYQTLHNEDTK